MWLFLVLDEFVALRLVIVGVFGGLCWLLMGLWLASGFYWITGFLM